MTELDLLQSVLAAEHAAVYAYGVLGPRLAEPQRAEARRDEAAHHARRDQLTGVLRARGADPVATHAAYDVTAATPADAVALALRLEEGTGVRWRDLVEGTDAADLRGLATAGLVDAAVRAARWRAAGGLPRVTVAFPGAPVSATPPGSPGGRGS